MDLQKVTLLIQQNHTELENRGVKSLAVFGSVARGESTKNSDLDLLVEFSQPVGLFEFIRLKKFIEDLTSCKVDLVTQDALHPAMRDAILNEAIYVC